MAVIYGHANMSLVYWIHSLAQSNPWLEGYIGVSSNPLNREKEHLRRLKAGNHNNIKLQRAYDKLKGQISIDVLFWGPEDVCYDMEKAFRGRPQIGWNIEAGGQRNSGEGGKKNLGRKRPDVSKRNYDISLNKWWTNKQRSCKDRQAKSIAAIKTYELGTHPAKQMVVCPHCNFKTGIGNAKRWHFDNCKERTCAVSLGRSTKAG